MNRLLIASLITAALVATGCGSGGDHANHSGSGDSHDSASMHEHGMVPGESGDPEAADREILVRATDDLKFTPSTIEVSAGETVTFVVRNEGQDEHEFVLGDANYQQQHAEDMEGDDHMMHMANAVTIEPGESAELTWRFDDPGEVLYGCHEPGHYEGGMVGTIDVS